MLVSNVDYSGTSTATLVRERAVDCVMSGQLVLQLPRTSQAPGIARRRLSDSFGAELEGLERDTASLLVSELVTNAVVHGRGRIELHAQLDQDLLRVEVIDEGPGFTWTVHEHDFGIPVGLGLEIVDAEASHWGIRDDTAHVWFELKRT
jgi:signal transduction histidine kinase